MPGLSSPRHGHSVVTHPLMWLGNVAWNREVRDPNYMLEETPCMLAKFDIPPDPLQSHLASEDRGVVVERMREYKRARFPEDTDLPSAGCACYRQSIRWTPHWARGE
jgi:hypothetical protein